MKNSEQLLEPPQKEEMLNFGDFVVPAEKGFIRKAVTGDEGNSIIGVVVQNGGTTGLITKMHTENGNEHLILIHGESLVSINERNIPDSSIKRSKIKTAIVSLSHLVSFLKFIVTS